MSCNSWFIEDDLPNTFEGNFQAFWEDMDRYYSYFDVRELDWQLAYDTNIQMVKGFTNTDELADLLSVLTLAFEDGHVNLYLPGNRVAFDFQEGFPENDPENATRYLDQVRSPNNVFSYGSITNTNLGYIRITSFGTNTANYTVIDDAIASLASRDGIVLDVRGNSGGDDRNSDIIASRFADERRLYRRIRYRNGTEHNDFTDWIDDFIEPEGDPFLKPVVVLTNRGCYSSTESFLLSMEVMPHVMLVGGITGGGSGNPILRQLPNGWTFRMSNWQQVNADFEYSEGVGITPDVEVNISPEEAENGVDTILEAAIALLQGN